MIAPRTHGLSKRIIPLLVLATVLAAALAPAAHAQMPVYKDGTKARNQPWPDDDHARDGVQMLVVGRTDSLRALWDGKVEITNAPQNVVYYHPVCIQSFTIPGQRADTTGALEIEGATQFYIDIYPTYDDSTGAQLMAMSYRQHGIQAVDSLSTYTQSPVAVPVGVPGAPLAVGDTLGSLKRVYLDNTLANPTITLRRNEYGLPLSHGPTPRGIRFGPFPIGAKFMSLSMRAVQVFNASGVAYSGCASSTVPCPHITYRVDVWAVR